jgi:hypothetical protein
MSNDTENKEATKHPISKLKVRRSTDKGVKIVNKPRKMKLVKPTRLPKNTDNFANSAMLVFPTDTQGITTEMRSSLIRAASRIGKDEKNMDLFMDTLDILVKHVEARFKQNGSTEPLKRREVGKVQEEETVPLEASVGPNKPTTDTQTTKKGKGNK